MHAQPKVIGLCGPEGAGKTTAANILKSIGFEIVPFAKPLKDMLRAIGVPERNLTGSPVDKLEPLALFNGRSARHAMQTLGTEWGRQQIANDFWARAWSHTVQPFAAAPGYYICADDIRFAQEVAAIKKLGGKVICIVRTDDDFQRVPNHASENFMALVPDLVIKNDGTIDQLRHRLLTAIECKPRIAYPAASPFGD